MPRPTAADRATHFARLLALGALAALALVQVAPMRSASADAPSYLDASYVIEGKTVTLANGLSEVEAAPGSASKVTTKVFGNEAAGDLNGDGLTDIAFLLTQDSGGSGTFYYVVAALKTADGYTGTNGILLGDRIAPQTTEVLADGTVIVNYADRAPGEPMTATPSVGVSKYLRVEAGGLVEIPAPGTTGPTTAPAGNAGPLPDGGSVAPWAAFFLALLAVAAVALARGSTRRASRGDTATHQ